MYEGLFHKFADQNVAAPDSARCRCRLSGGSNRGFRGGSRGGARSCSDGAEFHLTSDRMIGPLAHNLVGLASIPAFLYQTR
jgi:hypothetical protein